MNARLSASRGWIGIVLAGCALCSGLGAPAVAQVRWRSEDAVNLPAMHPADVGSTVRDLVPEGAQRHVILSFSRTPTTADRTALAALGLQLQAYLGNRSFFVAVDGDRLDAATLGDLGIATSAAAITPQARTHPRVSALQVPPWAVVGDPAAGRVAVYVILQRDENLARGAARITELGGRVRDTLATVNGLVVELPQNVLPALSDDDAVQWIEWPLPPLVELNNDNRPAIQADSVQQGPYNLNGSGVVVMVYDGGTALASHPDFSGRLTTHDNSGLSDHATHVAGTIGGDGSDSGGLYAGMAPGVTLESYGFEYNGQDIFLYTNPGDTVADYGDAISTYGAVIANNSIGTNTATNGFPCDITGDYGVMSSVIDGIVRGDLGTPMRVVWANGNERQTSTCGDLYATTAPPACAKNHLTVGALNANDDSVTGFTSWGPCDDGRLKPDLSAAGCQSDDDGGVTSTSSSGGYTVKCGTSMAAPTVTGAGALLIEDYRDQFPGRPDFLQSTMKVLMVHNTLDVENSGPDYQTGYGVVQIQDTIDFMRTDQFLESALDQGTTFTLFVDVAPGIPELKITLAWDDAPGTPNITPALVNDLDLRAISPGGQTFYPWTLDPASPSDPAEQNTADHLNNLEQVLVDAPQTGLWTVEVVGFDVPEGPQIFSVSAGPNLIKTSIALPDGAPDLLPPGQATNLGVQVRAVGESLVAGSPMLHYRTAPGAYTTAALTPLGGELYQAVLPAVSCSAELEYWFSAAGQISGEIRLPLNAPTTTFAPAIGETIELFVDDFQTDAGWSVSNDPGLADGAWDRGVPVDCDRGDPPADADGSGQCYLTDNSAANGCNSDVDDGSTTLTSPTIDVSAGGAVLSYARWYSNSFGNAPFQDVLEVEVSDDGGSNWTALETVGPAGAEASGGWVTAEYTLADVPGLSETAQFRLRFIAADTGDGSVVEAGIDAVSVRAVVCASNDADGDGVPDGDDNCPTLSNSGQEDADGDDIGDVCDQCPGFDDAVDADGDGVPDGCDPCPVDNPDDSDGDGVCDATDICPGSDDALDGDGDGVPDGCDACPLDNPDDSDGDGVCDATDICPGSDDAVDGDDDGVPDGCDACPLDNPDDSDGDGVCDATDICPGSDDALDGDGDGVPDGCDACPLDNPDDSDGDGVCDATDICPGSDDALDGDGDGVPDGCDACPLDNPDDSDGDGVCDATDICPGSDDALDGDGDGVPDGCDACPLDNPDDSDGDGVCDATDICPGSDDALDGDGDGVPDGCDACPLDNPDDSDGDGVCDAADVCPGSDDAVDGDGDGVPDGCDACPLDNPDDSDGDGVCDAADICPGSDDALDGDGDGVPDGCDACPLDNPDDSDGDGVCDAADVCPGSDDAVDGDGDGVPDGCDACPLDNPDDSDGDGVCDAADICPGSDDALDGDGDGVPDGCDACPLDNPDDSDGDGVCDAADVCPGSDDAVDGDGDGVPDGCDACPLDNPDDSDGDGVCDAADICPGSDDALDGDGDGVPDGCDACPLDNPDDSDGDGVCDANDICTGSDDAVDGDADGVPDGCDACPLDNPDDGDGDGVCDSADICPGSDDVLDGDGDGVPDGCDPCPLDNPDDSDGDGVCDANDICAGSDDAVDGDADGVPDGCDACPLDNPDDTDGDGVCNSVDICPGGHDATDGDGDGVPDGCDPCPLDNPDDSDGDGVCDANDICAGSDDAIDGDADGVPDGCDACPLDNPDDTDGDGVCESADVCPDHNDTLDADRDGLADGCDNCPQHDNPLQADCDADGIGDACAIADGSALDSNANGIPDACECAADLSGDTFVDSADLAILLGAWGPNAGHAADLNDDDFVDAADMAQLLGAWGPCTGGPGACCDVGGGGSCSVLTETLCQDSAGVYLGEDSTCAQCPPAACVAGSGDCCDPLVGAGCGDSSCCASVCAILPHCCAVGWDLDCALQAEVSCAAFCADPPANDDCADPLPIVDGDTPFDTSGATTDGEVHATCRFDGQTAHDIWYSYQATCSGTLTVSTCDQADYDTDLVVYQGCDCGSLILIGCDDDTVACENFTSRISVGVQLGQCYTIRVGGFGPDDVGSGTVTLTCEP